MEGGGEGNYGSRLCAHANDTILLYRKSFSFRVLQDLIKIEPEISFTHFSLVCIVLYCIVMLYSKTT